MIRLLLSRISLSSSFHTSPRSQALPPHVVLFIKPLSRIGAFVIGKTFKRLWRNLPKEKKEKYKEFVAQNNIKVGVLSGLISLAGLTAYCSHLEVNPISKKRYFMILNHDQMRKISHREFNKIIENHEGHILGAPNPAYERVVRVVTKLLDGNRDLTDVLKLNWTVSVVSDDEINAFVLQNGNIFVFTGMLKACQNDDQLAIVLSHEIAHVLLYHDAKLSYSSLVSILLLTPLAMIWALMPNDGFAIVANWFLDKCSSIIMELPFSREMEKEADEIGMLMAAKSCYDTREGPVFWGRMALREKVLDRNIQKEPLFSTHPTNESRQAHMDYLLEETMRVRLSCNCPSLVKEDPMLRFRRLENKIKL
ncbi:metalloendopeptidase OMA1, mitochondrial isoform X2 [Lepeophtheirus salmonis]|uniref:metalloendopeptidase OMA1, mitochondrial isoform X2 n=1 Tax=Lepeophtheirus salmonis TaxID=72036 RepID=UPI001AE866C2|nr:metalloendopeptidase OMA1, mitochondrial-like isoform X2 [Lepeophtheirus salmonis]